MIFVDIAQDKPHQSNEITGNENRQHKFECSEDVYYDELAVDSVVVDATWFVKSISCNVVLLNLRFSLPMKIIKDQLFE